MTLRAILVCRLLYSIPKATISPPRNTTMVSVKYCLQTIEAF